jgi:hypothetical protein
MLSEKPSSYEIGLLTLRTLVGCAAKARLSNPLYESGIMFDAGSGTPVNIS